MSTSDKHESAADQQHGHDHGHNHHGHNHHGHNHYGHHHHGASLTTATNQGRAFAIAITINALFVAIEFAYGFFANSTALLADAGHNLSDVLGLLLGWGAVVLARRAPTQRFSYGLRSSSILAALGNAMLLVMASGGIAWEALQRLSNPPAVASLTVMVVAGIGILVNGASALLFMSGQKTDLNLRGAYLHMATDAAVSLGVVVSGVIMTLSGWYWIDPLASLVIVGVILFGTWGLLKQSAQLALGAVPAHVDTEAISGFLKQCQGVQDIHDLHVWALSTSETALTVHLVMPQGYPGDLFMDNISQTLKDRYAIQHSTLQVEQGTTEHQCTLLLRVSP